MKKIITSILWAISLLALQGCYATYTSYEHIQTPISFYNSPPTTRDPLLIFHGQKQPNKPYIHVKYISASCYETESDDVLISRLKLKAQNNGIHAIILSPKNHYTDTYQDENSVSHYSMKEYNGAGIIYPNEIDSLTLLKAIYYVSNNDTVFEQQTDLWGNITSYSGDTNLYYFDYFNSLNHLQHETENWKYFDQGFQLTRKLYNTDTSLIKKVRFHQKGTAKQYVTVTHYQQDQKETMDTIALHFSGDFLVKKDLKSEAVGEVQEDFYYHPDGNINYREYSFKQNNSRVTILYEYYPLTAIKQELMKHAVLPNTEPD